MIRAVRAIGIVIGSLVIAYLAVSLVGGLLLGPDSQDGPLPLLAALVLGGFVFADIMRRERRRPEGASG